MKSLLAAAFVSALVLGSPAFGEEPAVKETVVVKPAVIELADGGKIVLDKEGRTYHTDANGKRVKMKDGVVMEGKDGQKYVHRNDAIWRTIVQKGTLDPVR